MAISGDQSKISQILEHSIMPWCARWGMSRIFTAVAQQTTDMELPEGMTATARPITGRRELARSGRPYGGASVVDAYWRADDLHSARTPKLCFVLAGAVAFRVADYLLHCKPGHGILLPPGVPFTNGRPGYLDFSQPHRGFCEILQLMPYRGGLICWRSENRLEPDGTLAKLEETCSIPYSAVTYYLDRLVDEATAHRNHRQIVCDGLLGIAMALLHRELQELPVVTTGTIADAVDEMPLGERREYSIGQAQVYIHNNLREPLCIDKVAHFVCMSRTAFTEQFRLHTGKTFNEYVVDERFAEVKRILVRTDLAVRHVASLVGLKPNRMRILFQEREGISPSEYRRRHRAS